MKRLLSLLLSTGLIAGMTVTPSQAQTSRVESLLEKMTLRQKIAQMMMMSFQVWDMDTKDNIPGEFITKNNPQIQKIVEDYSFGALIFFAGNIKTTEDTFNLTLAMQKAATKNGGIPLLISADQEGGKVFRLGSGTALPGNMALGATGDYKNAYEAGKIIGSELMSVGINNSLAPVVDVNCNANNPVIGLRSYGDDPDEVGNYAVQAIKGMAEYGVIGCAKHFPGHGDTAVDSHYGLPVVDKSLDELMKNELKPFEYAIKQGIDMIMTAHILYPQLESETKYSTKTGKNESLPSTMSRTILTGILREKLGFDGVICTDSMYMDGVYKNWTTLEASKIAVNAGVDLLCMPVKMGSLDDLHLLDEFIDGMVKAVEQGEVGIDRINDACRRILKLKEKRGILDFDESKFSVDKAKNVVGSESNRYKERVISSKAVTVVENNGILPLKLSSNDTVLMLSPYKNELGLLAMGWNRAKENGLIPDGAKAEVLNYTNLNEYVYKDAVNRSTKIILLSEISSPTEIKNKNYTYTAAQAILEYAKSNGKSVIVMSVDKPYDVQFYKAADAVLAVYGCIGSTVDPTEALLDGTTSEKKAFGPNITAGIEVIFGVFGASGKLPVNIPKFDDKNFSYGNEIVYKNGYGISYESLLKENEETSTPETQVTPQETEKTPTPEKKDSVLPKIIPIAAIAAASAAIIAIIRGRRKK